VSTFRPSVVFEWAVPTKGFRWHARFTKAEVRDLEKKGISVGPAGVTNAPPFLFPQSKNVQVTRPLEDHPLLFREFATLAETPEAILAFASQHGSLALSPGRPRNINELEFWSIHSIESWTDSICQMRTVLELWTAYDQKESEKLADMIKLRDGKVRGLDESVLSALGYKKSGQWIKRRNQQGRVRKSPSGLAQIALELVEEIVNDQSVRTSLQFRRPLSGAKFDLALAPRTLLDALWFQVSELLVGTTVGIECPGCGEKRVIQARASKGPDRLHCNNACRQRAQRLRNKARDLKAKRVSIKVIANELERAPGVIKKWLALEEAR
jgi:hypothetical protein